MHKDSLRSWVVILLVGLALTISQMDRMLLSIAAPKMMADSHMTGTALGVLLSSFSWTYTLFQLPSGWLVDRFGPKKVLAVAYFLWSLSCAATGLSSTFLFLIGCRLFLGAFEAPLYAVAHSTMATAFSDRRRALATAIYAKGVSLGPALGAVIGTYLMLNFGWSHMFFIVGIASLAFLIPWQLAVPASLDAPAIKKEEFNWTTTRQLLRSRAIWGVSLGYFGFLYLYYIYATWLPTYLSKERGMSMQDIAWLASVPFLISLVAGPLTGWLADMLIGKGYSPTIVRKAAIAIGLFLGAAIIPAVYATDPTTAAVLFVVALAGQAISATNMLALPSAIAPKGHAGFVGSLQQMLGALGGIISPIVTGIIYDGTKDFRAAIVVAGGMLVLAAFSFLVLIPRVEPVRLGKAATSPREGASSSAPEPALDRA
jgi:MFS transporter, ACS family, D-galactonate transporter